MRGAAQQPRKERMQTSAEYFAKSGYLLVKVLVPWTERNAKRVIDEAQDEATKRGHVRLLFDLSNWSAPDREYTRFSSGLHLAKVLGRPFKLAAFGPSEAINKFGENTAVNRGAHFRIFSDQQSALHWLMEDTRQTAPEDASAARSCG
jgi:hypothetical protein